MNLIQKITLTLAVVTTAAGFAQESSEGFLGQRYADISFGLSDNKSMSKSYDASFAVNLPVCKSADLSFGYAYDWLNGNPQAQAHTLTASAVYYTDYRGFKPFVGAGLGYQWSSATLDLGSSSLKVRDNDGIYGAGFGAEIKTRFAVLTPSVSYSNQFDGNTDGNVAYGVEAARWLAKDGVYARVSYVDDLSSSDSAWVYTIGFRAKF